MLHNDNPDPIDLICVHIYDPADRLIADAMTLARRLQKPLFIGEFGGESRNGFLSLLTAIENAEVPLAALWVYDYSSQEKSYNATWTNERAYQLQAIARANVRIRAALDAIHQVNRPPQIGTCQPV